MLFRSAGGSLGGRRFIPNITTLSKDAVDAINAKGLKRLNWEKPHIKIFKTGEGVKLAISQLLLDTIVGAQRGRYTASMSASKMGTGISPIETSELSGEFKKLVKVLSAGGKLSKTGDYYLLDIPTKYNEDRNQYEMPLPAEIAEAMLNESYYTNDLEDAKSVAQDISSEEGVAQHVNMRGNGYEVSDWFDSDTTVASFENGRSLDENESKLRSLIQQIIKEELDEVSSDEFIGSGERDPDVMINTIVKKDPQYSKEDLKKLSWEKLNALFDKLILNFNK